MVNFFRRLWSRIRDWFAGPVNVPHLEEPWPVDDVAPEPAPRARLVLPDIPVSCVTDVPSEAAGSPLLPPVVAVAECVEYDPAADRAPARLARFRAQHAAGPARRRAKIEAEIKEIEKAARKPRQPKKKKK